MSNYKACPFCGGNNIKKHSTPEPQLKSSFYQECLDCRARGPVGYVSQAATTLWNLRSADLKGLAANQYVRVFQRPVTGEEYEGRARLVRCHRPEEEYDGLSMWWVDFEDDTGEVLRTINRYLADPE